MSRAIIRQGDPTSHNGTVTEGSLTDICMGKAISQIGHMTHCPKCRGNFSIVEGVTTTTFYGKGVALEGMKTACGAVLIATQFTDTVDWNTAYADRSEARALSHVLAPTPQANQEGPSEHESSSDGNDDDVVEEHFYSLRDENNLPVDGYLYDLHGNTGLLAKGAPYTAGDTMAVQGDMESKLVYWLAKDGGVRS
jgi:uncharacterized Zn-binding protein involved in type VI secretion